MSREIKFRVWDKNRKVWGSPLLAIFGNTLGRVFWDEKEATYFHGNQAGRPPKRMWEYCEVIGNIYEHGDLLK